MSLQSTSSPCTAMFDYPLDAEIRQRLDPQYTTTYETHLQHAPQVHLSPISVSRGSGMLNYGGSAPLPVASIEDYWPSREDGGKVPVRVYTPLGKRPEEGWPVLVYAHGGGWVLGNLETEKSYCTNFATHSRCVVVAVGYRLAPECPFPAAVDDFYTALLWAHSEGQSLLGVDPTRIAVGGCSAGGNLSAVVTHMVHHLNGPKLTLQLLIVPVTDNSTTLEKTAYPSWQENALTPALSARKMIWYRDHYLPKSADWSNWQASPIFAPEGSLGGWKHCCPAFVAVTELDVLRDEGIAYAHKLKASGVSVTCNTYIGVPHAVPAMDGAIQKGADIVRDSCQALLSAFWL